MASLMIPPPLITAKIPLLCGRSVCFVPISLEHQPFLHLIYRILRQILKYIFPSVADPADHADLLTQPFLDLI